MHIIILLLLPVPLTSPTFDVFIVIQLFLSFIHSKVIGCLHYSTTHSSIHSNDCAVFARCHGIFSSRNQTWLWIHQKSVGIKLFSIHVQLLLEALDMYTHDLVFFHFYTFIRTNATDSFGCCVIHQQDGKGARNFFFSSFAFAKSLTGFSSLG